MVAAALGTSSTAYLVKPVLDEIFINKDEAMLKLLPPLVIVVYLLKGLGKFIQVYYTEYIGQDIIRRIRERMLKSLLFMPYSYFINQPSGELISRLTNDINRIKNVVANMIPDLLRESLTILALTAVVIYQSPKLALYFLVIMPLAVVPLNILAKKMKKASTKSQEKISQLTTHLSEIFNNIELIKAEAREKNELKRFAGHNRDFFDITLKQIRISESVSPLMEVLGAVIIALVIYIGGMEVINGEISTGTFFSFMTALFMLYTPIKNVSKLYNKLQDAVAAAERIFDIIDLVPDIKSGSKEPPKDFNTLCFDNVTLNYGSKEALRDVSFCATKNEITAIAGDSGSGKSSIINLIVRFFDPTSGKITIDGVDLKELDLEKLRKKIALVTQRVYLFQESIAKNVSGEENYDKERVVESLKKANAYEFVKSLPYGIETLLSESGANLSGGQRQRLAIARALYKDAKIIIFDEATSALDRKSEEEILKTLKRISKDKIVIIISHNLPSVTFADKILFMKNGKLICKGKHEKLMESCEEYRKLYDKFTT